MDSAEELLLVLEGTAEALIGEERGRLEAGELAVVPAMAPHDVWNTGDGVLRVLGFFSSSTVVATFDVPDTEGGDQVFVLGAPPFISAPLPEPAVS